MNLKLLGSKGTTGTQASFLELFDGDHGKVAPAGRHHRRENGLRGLRAGLGPDLFPQGGFPGAERAGPASPRAPPNSANDMRLLQHMKEMEEPFEKNQIGSSAMAYKRNPMRCERMAALARYLMIDSLNPGHHRGYPVV